MSLTMAVLIASITVFVLAIFLGFELISKVPATLHTPLMSGSNAISGIAITQTGLNRNKFKLDLVNLVKRLWVLWLVET